MAIFTRTFNRFRARSSSPMGWALGLALSGVFALAVPAARLAADLRPNGAAGGRQEPQAAAEQKPSALHVFENDEIKVLIPPGWAVSPDGNAASQPLSQLGPHVQLAKNGFTLSLAYAATPKGDPQTRFAQIFAMPWLTPNQTLGCSYYLRRTQKIINANLLFLNLSLSAADPGIDKSCGVPSSAGARWFAGFFTNTARTYFLNSKGAGCHQKAYILTSAAQTPDQLPEPDDPSLTGIVGEAGRIVASIQYKRCPLASDGPPPSASTPR